MSFFKCHQFYNGSQHRSITWSTKSISCILWATPVSFTSFKISYIIMFYSLIFYYGYWLSYIYYKICLTHKSRDLAVFATFSQHYKPSISFFFHHFIGLHRRHWETVKKREIKLSERMLSKTYSSTWLYVDSVCGMGDMGVTQCPSAVLPD